MAQSSGSFKTGIHNNWQRFRVDWSSEQSIENNSSKIYLNMYMESDGSFYKRANLTGNTITINNNTTGWTSYAIEGHSGSFTQLIGSAERTIQHNDDGTARFDISVFYNFQVNLGGTFYQSITASASGIELPTIPRASTIGVNDANIGSNTTITLNKKVSSFTTNLYWRVQGDSNWTYIANTSQSSYAWTVSTSLYSRIPNNKTIVCEFLARTLSGSTVIGDKTTTATFTATGNPIINSCTLVSIDTTTIDLVGASRMIRYISTVQATVSASGQNSATISSIKVNGKTASNGVATFTNADTYSYDVTVTDSRGYTATRNFEITWTNYIPLTINANAVRNQPTDGKVNITVNGNYFNSSFRTSSDNYIANTLTLSYRIRESGGSSWTNWRTLTPIISNNTYSLAYQESDYNYTKQYEMEVKVVDKVSTKTVTSITISKGQPVFNWGEDFFNVNGIIKQYNRFAFNNDGSVSDIDLNNLTTAGFCYLQTNLTNTPPNINSYAYLLVFNASGGDLIQICISVVNLTRYIRSKYTSGGSYYWTSWTQI